SRVPAGARPACRVDGSRPAVGLAAVEPGADRPRRGRLRVALRVVGTGGAVPGPGSGVRGTIAALTATVESSGPDRRPVHETARPPGRRAAGRAAPDPGTVRNPLRLRPAPARPAAGAPPRRALPRLRPRTLHSAGRPALGVAAGRRGKTPKTEAAADR